MVQTIAKEDFQSGYFYSVCDLCLFTEEKKLTRRPGNYTNCCRTSHKIQITWLWQRLLMLLLLPQVSLISLVVILGMLRKSLRVGSTVCWTSRVGIALATAGWNCLLRGRH